MSVPQDEVQFFKVLNNIVAVKHLEKSDDYRVIYNKDGTIHSEDFNFAGGTHLQALRHFLCSAQASVLVKDKDKTKFVQEKMYADLNLSRKNLDMLKMVLDLQHMRTILRVKQDSSSEKFQVTVIPFKKEVLIFKDGYLIKHEARDKKIIFDTIKDLMPEKQQSDDVQFVCKKLVNLKPQNVKLQSKIASVFGAIPNKKEPFASIASCLKKFDEVYFSTDPLEYNLHFALALARQFVNSSTIQEKYRMVTEEEINRCMDLYDNILRKRSKGLPPPLLKAYSLVIYSQIEDPTFNLDNFLKVATVGLTAAAGATLTTSIARKKQKQRNKRK